MNQVRKAALTLVVMVIVCLALVVLAVEWLWTTAARRCLAMLGILCLAGLLVLARSLRLAGLLGWLRRRR